MTRTYPIPSLKSETFFFFSKLLHRGVCIHLNPPSVPDLVNGVTKALQGFQGLLAHYRTQSKI